MKHRISIKANYPKMFDGADVTAKQRSGLRLDKVLTFKRNKYTLLFSIFINTHLYKRRMYYFLFFCEMNKLIINPICITWGLTSGSFRTITYLPSLSQT